MPDWSYRTVFRPLLFRLPFPVARDLCLGFIGTLARLPLGSAVIDFLGHMRPDPRLSTSLAGLELPSPIVLGPWLDTRLSATTALARFGFGLVEVGPVALTADGDPQAVQRRDSDGSLQFTNPLPVASAESAVARLARSKPSVPVLVRLQAERGQPAATYTAECTATCAKLALHAAAVALVVDDATSGGWSPAEWQQHVEALVKAAVAPPGALPVLVCLRADANELQHLFASTALAAGARGIIVDGLLRERNYDGDWLVGRAAWKASLATVERLRREIPADVPIIAGGADDPKSALELLAAGATAVQIDAGLVYSGPGLPKRINDAVLFAKVADTLRVPSVEASGTRSVPTTDLHAAAMAWFWAMLLGISMLLGGGLAMSIAATRVVLPYDEAYLGMTAAELSARIPRVLDFMAHDRITLAGTMLAVGIQYVCLAWFAIRRGLHWAKLTVVVSAFAGFASFFLFLGFGYFDPLHAFVTAILFQFLLLAFQGRLAQADPPAYPGLTDDWRWKLANWGQLLLVIQGVAVLAAGITISSVGITTVFVKEDLEFMQTTDEALRAANPRLVPVVAHDRASFGGMLISVGLATLLPALWGIRHGERWLWWMFALAGTVAYDATLVVHLHVGYTDPVHLAPAFGGLALLWLALALLFPYLFTRDVAHMATWKGFLTHVPEQQA
jgi:dihydroorotate dehydrogenase